MLSSSVFLLGGGGVAISHLNHYNMKNLISSWEDILMLHGQMSASKIYGYLWMNLKRTIKRLVAKYVHSLNNQDIFNFFFKLINKKYMYGKITKPILTIKQ